MQRTSHQVICDRAGVGYRPERFFQAAASAQQGGDATGEEQPPPNNPPPAQDSIVLANGKVRIGAVFFGDFAVYTHTGFGPQFLTQTNFPGPGNNDFTSFDVNRAYINLFYNVSDHLTFRVTPNVYREIITGTADKAGAVAVVMTVVLVCDDCHSYF